MPITNTLATLSARGFGYGTDKLFNEQVFANAGTFSFVVPTGVTKLTMVAVGGGGAAGQPGSYTGAVPTYPVWTTPPGSASGTYYAGGGGALAYANEVAVTPGQVLTVRVGSAGFITTAGDDSYVETSGAVKIVHAGGGKSSDLGTGGAVLVGTGGAGGAGGNWSPIEDLNYNTFAGWRGAGGGGAGGYSGSGGAGGNGSAVGASGSGGAAGGGGGGGTIITYYSSGGGYYRYLFTQSGSGGGVGLYGSGSNGVGGTVASGTNVTSHTPSTGGGAGSGGVAGVSGSGSTYLGAFDVAANCFGAGGAMCGTGVYTQDYSPYDFYNPSRGTRGNAGGGAVRILWTTNSSITRAFPSTNVGPL